MKELELLENNGHYFIRHKGTSNWRIGQYEETRNRFYIIGDRVPVDRNNVYVDFETGIILRHTEELV